MSRYKIDPWHYQPIPCDSATSALHRKNYEGIKTKDFYNLDYRVIPKYVEPGKLLLYRYVRYEPYFGEMLELNRELHPDHPLHPTTEEIEKIANKRFFSTRSPMKIPLTKRQRKAPLKKSSEKSSTCSYLSGNKNAAMLAAGLSETEIQFSCHEVARGLSDSPPETASGSFNMPSCRSGSSKLLEERLSEELTKGMQGVRNVREFWSSLRQHWYTEDSHTSLKFVSEPVHLALSCPYSLEEPAAEPERVSTSAADSSGTNELSSLL